MADFSDFEHDWIERYLSYDAYLRSVPHEGASVGSEGDTFHPLSREQWEALPPTERMYNLGVSPGTSAAQNITLNGDDPAVAAFRARFGDETWAPGDSGRPEGMGHLEWSPTVPWEGDVRQWAIDPSRVMRLPDGSYLYEPSNVRGQYVAQAQATNDRESNQFMARGVASLAAMGVGAGAYAAAGEGATAGMVAGTDAAESAGTLALNAAGTGVAPYVPAGAETIGAAATGAGATTTGGAATTTGGAATTTGGAETGSGIINGVRQAGSNVMDWYNGLSSGSRFILNQSLSAASRSALAARQQTAALNAQRERENTQHQHETEAEEQRRQDHIRRSSVSAFSPNAFTPRTGIIDSRRPGG